MNSDTDGLDETNMEVTVTSDKNLVTSQGQLITVNSSDLLNIQVSGNSIDILPTSNGLPVINGSLSSTTSSSLPTTTTRSVNVTLISTTISIRRGYSHNSFSYFSLKICGGYSLGLSEMLLMSTHNIGFLGEIRKISAFSVEESVLTGAMFYVYPGPSCSKHH